MKQKSVPLCLCTSVVMFVAGCVSTPVRLENSARLIGRPDFTVAREAAPEWCRDALKTINELESHLERK